MQYRTKEAVVNGKTVIVKVYPTVIADGYESMTDLHRCRSKLAGDNEQGHLRDFAVNNKIKDNFWQEERIKIK